MRFWSSPVKLNLFLYIKEQRSQDNYHNLHTLFQLLDYGDTLGFQCRQDHNLCLKTPISGISENNNLVLIAARALQNYAENHHILLKRPLGVDIHLNKKVPFGAGLGGGSSNAATTLIALNHMWGLGLSSEQLLHIGRQIGADVPVFISGRSAFGEGIGDILTPIVLPEKTFLVVTPSLSISTRNVFDHLHQARNSQSALSENCFNHSFHNDFEPLVRQLYPELDKIIDELQSIAPFRMTGTGSSIFAAFDNIEKALNAQKKLSKNIRSFVAKGLNYSPLYNLDIN